MSTDAPTANDREIEVEADGTFQRPPTEAELATYQRGPLVPIAVPEPPPAAAPPPRIASPHDRDRYLAVNAAGHLVDIPNGTPLPPGARLATQDDVEGAAAYAAHVQTRRPNAP